MAVESRSSPVEILDLKHTAIAETLEILALHPPDQGVFVAEVSASQD